MNRAIFFATMRSGFGPLTDIQVQVAEAILDAAALKKLSAQHTAYILATGWGEAKLTPVRENMSYTVARIRQVWPSRPEAVRFARKPKPLANSVYGGRLGNLPGTDDGWNFRGGGIDQLTGRANYGKIGIVYQPDEILQPGRAVASIMHGMTTGRYTGRKLADYGDGAGFDARAARAIVNGDVRLNGAKYAAFHQVFMRAIIEAGGVGHVTETPKPEHVAPVVLPPAPSFWAGIIAALVAFFTRGK